MQPTLKAIREEIERAYDAIHGGNPTELRVLQPSVGSGTFNDRTKLVSTALNLSQRVDIPGTFWTIQKLKDARSTNTWAWHVASTNSNDDIEAFNWAILDCDPRRGSEISSTDAEKAAALTVAEDIRSFLNVHAIPHIFADSGNGWHVLVPIHILNQNGGAGLVKRVTDAFSARYSTDAVFVDTKVANPGRILKVYGTAVRKGQHSDERPHRLSRIVDAPEIASRLNEAQLESLLAKVLDGLTPEQQEKLSPVQSADAAPADAVEFSMQEPVNRKQ